MELSWPWFAAEINEICFSRKLKHNNNHNKFCLNEKSVTIN